MSLRSAGIRIVLLDIEGTTTPISFVYDVLFPYARGAVGQYLTAAAPNDGEIRRVLDDLEAERAGDLVRGETPPAWSDATTRERAESATAYVHWLMDRDRKSGPLKTLQGLIWSRGYADGSLKGEVYPDVPPALTRWTNSGIGVGIFSSGSVLAQKLLFGSTPEGDLTPFLRWHFDTNVGAKQDARSYQTIAGAVGVPPQAILFISDVERELAAAREAGLHVRLCLRGPMPAPPDSISEVITTFDQIDV